MSSYIKKKKELSDKVQWRLLLLSLIKWPLLICRKWSLSYLKDKLPSTANSVCKATKNKEEIYEEKGPYSHSSHYFVYIWKLKFCEHIATVADKTEVQTNSPRNMGQNYAEFNPSRSPCGGRNMLTPIECPLTSMRMCMWVCAPAQANTCK